MSALSLPIPLDELEPEHRALALRVGFVRAGQLVAVRVCPACVRPMTAACERCGGVACGECSECQGCHRVICQDCDGDATLPKFAFPGDAYFHPHSLPLRGVDG